MVPGMDLSQVGDLQLLDEWKQEGEEGGGECLVGKGCRPPGPSRCPVGKEEETGICLTCSRL